MISREIPTILAPDHPPRRILVIRPSALGDVCRSVPVLASLRAAFPGASIDWVVQDSFIDAVRAHPMLTEAIPFPRRAPLGNVVRWMDSLRGRKYDLVLDCQGLARSGLFAWWTRAPVRVGDKNARELGWLGLTHRIDVEPSLHAVDRMLALLAPIGVEPVRDMRLHAPQSDRQRLSEDADFVGRYAVLAPASRWPGKEWPVDRFVDLCSTLLDAADRVVLLGSPGERERSGSLIRLAQSEPRVLDRIGKTSIGRAMAIIEKSALVVANDSAALHMAVGFDRPLVALFGPTDVAKVGPYRREADVIQHVTPQDRLDHKDEALGRSLMERITTEEVIARAMKRLDAHT